MAELSKYLNIYLFKVILKYWIIEPFKGRREICTCEEELGGNIIS